jgi:hypothetical protein
METPAPLAGRAFRCIGMPFGKRVVFAAKPLPHPPALARCLGQKCLKKRANAGCTSYDCVAARIGRQMDFHQTAIEV